MAEKQPTVDLDAGELPLSSIRVMPSAPSELFSLLWRLERTNLLGEPTPVPNIPSGLPGAVAAFWPDGVRGFTEVFVLAQWAGTLFDTDLKSFLERLPEVVQSADFREITLSSEPADQRQALVERISRLRDHSATFERYRSLLADVWTLARPLWNSQALLEVLNACQRLDSPSGRAIEPAQIITGGSHHLRARV
jgi:hypothetical protein